MAAAAHLDQPPVRVTRVVGYAYPWDVIGDPGFLDRVVDLGIDEVGLAATYHGTRAATPLHPAHRLIEAPTAALYRPVRESAWGAAALRPVPAPWVPAVDSFGEAAALLIDAGIRVQAWVVLAHSSRLGAMRPDLAVRNCFGDRYSYALCPAHDEVVDYAATLAAEAVREVAVSGVSVESLGQMGVAHNGLHEKTDGTYGPAAQRALSVCCCDACQRRWLATGFDATEMVRRLRDAVLVAQEGVAADASMSDLVGGDHAAALLASRWTSQIVLRRRVLDALRDGAPGARITLHGQADAWATGPSPAVTASALRDTAVDALLVPAWPAIPATYAAITEARALVPAGMSVGAYLTVLPPADLTTVVEHAQSVVRAGADELHLYHLGLANRTQLATLGELAQV